MPPRIKLTPDQTRVMSRILDFLGSSDRVFILKGYAGTGKTTLLKFLIRELDRLHNELDIAELTAEAARQREEKLKEKLRLLTDGEPEAADETAAEETPAEGETPAGAEE